MGWLLVGNRSGLLELAAQLQRIARAPAGTDTGRFSMMPYHKDLEALRCRKNNEGMAGAILGVVVNEAIDEPDRELLAPIRHGVVARTLGAVFWIGLLFVILLGAKELIRLLADLFIR